MNTTVTSIASTTFPSWMVTTAIFLSGIAIFCHLVVLALKGWWALLQIAYEKGAMDKVMEMKEKHDQEQYETADTPCVFINCAMNMERRKR